MIQRVQTIFLLIAVVCGFGVLAWPFATTPDAIQSSSLFSDSSYSVNDHIGLLVLFALAGAFALAGIFLYKNRQVQMKLVRIAIIAGALGFVLAVILLWQDQAAMDFDLIKDGVGAYLPFGLIIFALIALRYIQKDENLVKSMDRLR